LINGHINDLTDADWGRFYVGKFDYIIRDGVSFENQVDNVFFTGKNGIYFNGFGSENDYSLDLQVVKNIGGALYFGGKCDADPDNPSICVSRFLGGTFQTILANNDTWRNRQVNDIIFDGESSLIFGGDLDYESYAGNYGKHLLIYNIFLGSSTPHAYFDYPVHGLAMFNDEIHLGGEFTSRHYQIELPHLAKITTDTGVDEILDISTKEMFPNPFSEKITSTGNIDNFYYEIYSITGKMVKKGLADGKTINDLEILPSGLYALKIFNKGKTYIQKILKE